MAQDAADVLVPAEEEEIGWRRATLLQRLPGDRVLVRVGAKQQELQYSDVLPAGPSNVDDLTSLPHLDEPQLLDVIATRFREGMIYTACGPLLLAVNPWRVLPLYTLEHHAKYKELACGNTNCLDAPPHVFGVAAAAFLSLRREGSDQTIVVSGESGAGKSRSARWLLQELVGFTANTGAEMSNVDCRATSATSLGEKLLLATEVLDPFGSAQTRRNPQ